jgi:hypothetical protein
MKPPYRDDDVTAILQSSAVVGFVANLLTSVRSAAQSSRLFSPIRLAAAFWQTSPSPSRQLALGILAASASSTHLVLSLIRRPAPGWLWLILPLAAGAFGLLLIASGWPRTRHDADS